jgi:hypothetical protein
LFICAGEVTISISFVFLYETISFVLRKFCKSDGAESKSKPSRNELVIDYSCPLLGLVCTPQHKAKGKEDETKEQGADAMRVCPHSTKQKGKRTKQRSKERMQCECAPTKIQGRKASRAASQQLDHQLSLASV